MSANCYFLPISAKGREVSTLKTIMIASPALTGRLFVAACNLGVMSGKLQH